MCFVFVFKKEINKFYDPFLSSAFFFFFLSEPDFTVCFGQSKPIFGPHPRIVKDKNLQFCPEEFKPCNYKKLSCKESCPCRIKTYLVNFKPNGFKK